MRVVCASICYRGYADDEVSATLEHAPRIGYRYMEVHGPMTGSPAALDTFDLQGFRSDLDRAGMSCVGIYPPCWGGPDEPTAREHAAAIAQAVRYVAELGGDHVSTTGGSARGEPGAIERVILCVREALERIPQSCDVRLTLEPHLGNVLEQEEDFEEVLAAVRDQRVGICVDTGHFHSARVDTVRLIQRHAPRIFAVHLKDHIGATSVGIGRGEIDLASIVTALRTVNYAGDLTVELEVDDPENLPRYTAEAYTYVNGLLNQKL